MKTILMMKNFALNRRIKETVPLRRTFGAGCIVQSRFDLFEVDFDL